jgi:hypothetical protein
MRMHSLADWPDCAGKVSIATGGFSRRGIADPVAIVAQADRGRRDEFPPGGRVAAGLASQRIADQKPESFRLRVL